MKTTVKTARNSHVETARIGPNLVSLEICNFGGYECAYMEASAAHVLGSALIALAEKIEQERLEREAGYAEKYQAKKAKSEVCNGVAL